MPWKLQPIRGQHYRCIFYGMQRVVFHSTFPSFLALNSLLGSIWGLLRNELRNLSTPANHYKHFRSHPEIVSEDFRKFLKNHKHLKITFEAFAKISEHFRRFSENFKIMKTSGNHFWTVSEVFQKFHKSFKLQKRVWSVSEVFGNSRRFPSSSKNFHKFSED